MVDKGESQKAFTYLLGNLKPMPNISSEDLHALTVMLTCRNVAESDPSWPGVAASREALANQVLSLGVADLPTTDAPPDITQIVPPRRLNVLLEQAVMYQRSRSDAGSSMTLPCRSLLRDYEVTGASAFCSCFTFCGFSLRCRNPNSTNWMPQRRQRTTRQVRITRCYNDYKLDPKHVIMVIFCNGLLIFCSFFCFNHASPPSPPVLRQMCSIHWS